MNVNQSDEPLVSEAMSSPVLTVDPEALLGEVARVLVENKVSGLPVVDALGRVLGVITEADLLPKQEDALLKPRGLFEGARSAMLRTKREAVTARQAMTAGAVSVDPACSLRAAARVMESRKLRRLLVVAEDEGLVGIISRRDIVREFTRGDSELHEEIVHRLSQQVGIAAVRVRVSVQDGTVDLAGVVRSKDDLNRVRTLAATTRGVLAVRDRVTVDDGPAADLRDRRASRSH